MDRKWAVPLAGFWAGAVNGLFGAGGGMVLVPLLTGMTDLKEEEIFPCSIAIILPLCFVNIGVTALHQGLDFATALPYLLGSVLGGIPAGLWGRRIPTVWLHRLLGLLILWGGFRYLW